MSGNRAHGEGTYYERPESQGGGYLFRIMAGGQRVSGSGRTKKEAKAKAMERARLVGPRRTKGTLAELVDEWAELRNDGGKRLLKPTTKDQYLTLLRSRVVPVIGNHRVESLTKRTIAEAFPPDSTASASTQRSTYAALVRLLDYAVRRGRLALNVAREVDRPAKPSRTQPRSVDQKAAGRMLAAAADDRLGIAAWLGFGCGLRRGEMLALRWSDVDLEAGEISVSGNVTRSSAGLARGTTKTEHGDRLVPVPPVVVKQLRAHRERQDAERAELVSKGVGEVWVDNDLVLANHVGGMVEPRKLSKRWQVWAKAAKLGDTGTHVGRHYAASTLLASGAASVADVAAQLGHDPAVLLNTYATAVAKGQRAAAEALGETLIIVPLSVPHAVGQQGTE